MDTPLSELSETGKAGTKQKPVNRPLPSVAQEREERKERPSGFLILHRLHF
jgi:hypothetical protein